MTGKLGERDLAVGVCDVCGAVAAGIGSVSIAEMTFESASGLEVFDDVDLCSACAVPLFTLLKVQP